MLLVIGIGVFWGILLYWFTYIASKKSGRYYLAPLVPFLGAIFITVYGWIFVGGFEGMGYGILAIGFWIVSILGTFLLVVLVRIPVKKPVTKIDKWLLFLLPMIFIGSYVLGVYLDDNYWLIDKGKKMPTSQDVHETVNQYEISTIEEGKIQIYIVMSKKHIGKSIEVEKVSEWGATKITVKVTDGNHSNLVPFLRVGLDEIKEPLEIVTTDGEEIVPKRED